MSRMPWSHVSDAVLYVSDAVEPCLGCRTLKTLLFGGFGVSELGKNCAAKAKRGSSVASTP